MERFVRAVDAAEADTLRPLVVQDFDEDGVVTVAW